jgi:hypothetical protein
MNHHVVEARHVRGHTLWLRFRDGTAGEIDLAPALRGPVMEPLKDVEFFRQFRIHPEFRTLVWPRPFTDEEILDFSRRNPGYQFERSPAGDLIMLLCQRRADRCPH